MKVASLILVVVLMSVLAESSGIVAVNQAGYLIAGSKYAILASPADSFLVENVETGAAVFRGPVHLLSAFDTATGFKLNAADFTALATPGRYCVRTSSGGASAHFLIADTVFQPVCRLALRSYFLQRCGVEVPQSLAGLWWHRACHVNTDGVFHSTAERTGFAAVSGGWHDAGDYGKYVVNAGVTIGTMLMAYEFFPSRFRFDDLMIPESGNGVPDLLDEVRYELDWIFRMQAADGGVFHKVTKPQFEGFVMPEDDTGDRNIYRVSSAATADFAAVMAQASRVFQPFDSSFAARCLKSAVEAWHYLQVHPVIVPPGGFRNPAGTVTGEYGDSDDSDERLWVAAELYLATGDPSAHAHFIRNYASHGIAAGEISWRDVRTLAVCAYLRGARDGIDTTIQGIIRQSLLRHCQAIVAMCDGNGFRTALPHAEYSWGSNSRILNNAVLLIIGRMEGGDGKLEDAAMQQLHYILGVNAHSMSFVTGIGTRSPMNPHHRPSGADGVSVPVPGLVVGGPNARIRQDAVLKSMFTAFTPPALCYVDSLPSYASNETAINWNAPLVFLAGYFAGASSGDPSHTRELMVPKEGR